jgi:hypothetical protein
MRRTSDDFDAVGSVCSHRQRGFEIDRTVVNFGNEVERKVDKGIPFPRARN